MTSNLQKIPLFSQLSQNEIDEILSFSKIIDFQKGNILFLKGDRVRYFTALLSGQLKIYKSNSKGDEVLIHRFSYPTSIAEMPFFEDLPYPASCVAEAESQVILIDGEEFRNFLEQHPKLLYKFISSLSKKIRVLEDRIETLSILSAKERVEKFIESDKNRFLSMKKIDIAEELNITPEHLSRVLRGLKL